MNKLRIIASLALLTALVAPGATFAASFSYTDVSTSTYATFAGFTHWTTGPLVPEFTSIGPGSSLEISLTLTGNLTTADEGILSAQFGAQSELNTFINPGDEAFGFTYQLLENGVAVGPQFGYDLLNPFPSPENSFGVGTYGGPVNVTFNGVEAIFYNNSQNVSLKNIYLTIDIDPTKVGTAVPDSGPTLGLIGLATLGLVALRRKFGRA